MQINNHLPPTNLGHGARPDQTGNTHGRSAPFQPATDTAVPSDTTAAAAPAEASEEATGPGKSALSVAHRARAHLSGLALAGAENHNFGWLVSQIARGLDLAPSPPEGDGADDGLVVTEDPAPVDEAVPPADETADAATTPGPAVEEDPISGLLSDVIDEATTPAAEGTGDIVGDLIGTLMDETADATDAA